MKRMTDVYLDSFGESGKMTIYFGAKILVVVFLVHPPVRHRELASYLFRQGLASDTVVSSVYDSSEYVHLDTNVLLPLL